MLTNKKLYYHTHTKYERKRSMGQLNKTKVLLFSFIILLFILSACGTATLKLKQDGSGQIVMEVPSNEMLSAAMFKSELERELDGKSGIKGLSVKEKNGTIKASFKFDDLRNVDPDSYHDTISDHLLGLGDNPLDSIIMVDESKEFTENGSEILVRLPSDLNDFDQAEVIFDGHVVAHSDGVELINDHTVEVSYGDAYVIYEPKGKNASAIFPVIIIVLLIGGIFYYIRKRNNKNGQTEKVDNAQA